MLRVVFCGTPDIAAPALQALHQHPDVEVICVISQPDRPAGRGNKLKSPEVVEMARELGLKIHQTENLNRDADFLSELELNPPDFFVVFAFAQFLGKRVLELPRLGCFNIHTSLLPRHRGAAPIHYGIWKGDKTGGVSIQRMVKQMDAGDICFARELEIGAKETTPTLYGRLKDLAASSITPFIDAISTDTLIFKTQDESAVTFAPTIKKEEGLVNPAKLSALEIERRVRAFQPWPGVQLMFGDKRCKILESNVADYKISSMTLEKVQGKLILGCLGSSLEITTLQLEGKSAQNASAWLNGLQGNLPLISTIEVQA